MAMGFEEKLAKKTIFRSRLENVCFWSKSIWIWNNTPANMNMWCSDVNQRSIRINLSLYYRHAWYRAVASHDVKAQRSSCSRPTVVTGSTFGSQTWRWKIHHLQMIFPSDSLVADDFQIFSRDFGKSLGKCQFITLPYLAARFRGFIIFGKKCLQIWWRWRFPLDDSWSWTRFNQEDVCLLSEMQISHFIMLRNLYCLHPIWSYTVVWHYVP